jgi:hypothetical protein
LNITNKNSDSATNYGHLRIKHGGTTGDLTSHHVFLSGKHDDSRNNRESQPGTDFSTSDQFCWKF